ncbi:hypothetical protein DFO70_13118 [Cytobacillus firmus]|uniref:Uncharacterized protein n=2 Tax=Cytobacillus TaxID=2675230 RepID=A0A366JK31_CYTFI|nr:hypothetical protein DFO70_13118 [Cytobacillus firmus]TDX36402.1 hypothetical protein DFO72_12019 [Cytobacillus oceanisediminis]
MRKSTIIAWLVLIVGIVILYFPVTLNPPNDTRIILEHNYKTYIAPPCFESSNPTNYLEEATLQKAFELNYQAHSECTNYELKPEKNTVINLILKKLDIIESKWDW